jgi:lysophospholipase L1-like esterase
MPSLSATPSRRTNLPRSDHRDRTAPRGPGRGRALLSAVALVACLVLTGCATSAVAAPAAGSATTESGPVRVMPLGDSITDGYTVEGGYRTRLWTRLTADHVAVDLVGSRESGPAELGDKANEGHVGLRADEITAQVTSWLTQARPDVVLLHIGTNDLGEVSGAETAAHLDALLAEIYRAQPQTHVVVTTIIPMLSGVDAERDAYNSAIPGIVDRYRSAGRAITTVDMSHLLDQATDYVDELHPNRQGYDRMADAWYPAVVDAYAAVLRERGTQ